MNGIGPGRTSTAGGKGFAARLYGMAVVLALVSGCSTATRAPAGVVVGQVDADAAVGHLRALQKIADDNGGTRAALTPGYEASVEYVVRVLRAAGYDVGTPTYHLRPEGHNGREDDDGPPLPNDDGRPLRNVVAQTKSGDPHRVIFLGAHLDSVPAGPGINDNGTGVAAELELATRLGANPALRNAVRFAFWGSEEQDDQGSLYYVAQLSPEERADIMLYLNLDMLASPNVGYFVQGGHGKRPSRAGPPGSALVAQVLTDQLARAGVAAESETFENESDYEGFVKSGIPSAGLLTGDTAKKTESQAAKWGGQAGKKFDSCYHSACDTVANVDKSALARNIRAVAGTVDYFGGFDGRLEK